MAIVPALLIAVFWFLGALEPMKYCVIVHNNVPGLGKWNHLGLGRLRWIFFSPLLLVVAAIIFRTHADRAIAARRVVLFLTGGIIYIILRSYWPLVTPQDYLPLLPLFITTFTPLLLVAVDRLATRAAYLTAIRSAAPVLVVGLEMWGLFTEQRPWENRSVEMVEHLSCLLRLANPDDWVMDGKGETIYWQRPYYYVLEGVTLYRMNRGMIVDDIPEHLIEKRTRIVHKDRLHGKTKEFIKANYLPIFGTTLVAGQWLSRHSDGSPIVFTTLFPASYAIIAKNGLVPGNLDGQPISGPQLISAGRHEFQAPPGSGELALIWSQAIERGFSPFAPDKVAKD
jgi:hypothetical protein